MTARFFYNQNNNVIHDCDGINGSCADITIFTSNNMIINCISDLNDNLDLPLCYTAKFIFQTDVIKTNANLTIFVDLSFNSKIYIYDVFYTNINNIIQYSCTSTTCEDVDVSSFIQCIEYRSISGSFLTKKKKSALINYKLLSIWSK